MILDWGLNLAPPTLKDSALPLGYRGGGPWLGIEPGTSHTQKQRSTTRLETVSLYFQILIFNYKI